MFRKNIGSMLKVSATVTAVGATAYECNEKRKAMDRMTQEMFRCSQENINKMPPGVERDAAQHRHDETWYKPVTLGFRHL